MLTDELPAPVDDTIADNDGMFERHAPHHVAHAHYVYCGRSALGVIRSALAAAGAPEVRRVLDLPCGHGRVLRVLKAAFPAAELHACDLDRDGVDFCARQFAARGIPSHPDPRRVPLDGPYDLIWVGSLMTHLDAPRWPGFLELFRSHLAVGGVCVFTAHGRWPFERVRAGQDGYGLKNPAGLVRPFQKYGFSYLPYPGQDYGISLSSVGWVTNQLFALPGVRLLTYHERGWADHQDVVAFTRTD